MLFQMLHILNKRYCNNTVYHSLKFCGCDNLRAIQSSNLGDTLGVVQPPHLLASMSSCFVCQFQVFFLFQFFIVFNGGYEATPLWVVRVPLPVGGSILHQGGRCQFFPFPNVEGYLTVSLPPSCLALPTMTQFGEWSRLSLGSLSASVNGH